MPSSDLFCLQLRARDGERGFRVTYHGDQLISDVKVEWEYEAAGTRHPRGAPHKDRIITDFAPGDVVERWFSHSPDDGLFSVLVASGPGAPDIVFSGLANPDAKTPEQYVWES